jgi:hypothetical protein
VKNPQLFAEIHLPALTSFYGPSDLIPMFLPGRSISSATILWQAGVQIHNAIEWSLELASVVAKYLSGVSTLKMREYSPKAEDDGDDDTEPATLRAQNALVKALGYVMHLFPKLKHFDIMYEALIDGPKPVLKDLDKEFDTVISWGRACPSLCTCRLPTGVLWVRLKPGDDVWYPASEPHRKIGEEWLMRGMITDRYPFVDQVMEALAQ